MRSFICNIIPNKYVVDLKSAQAANNFCFSLINSHCFDNSFSIVPVSWYHESIRDDNNIKYFCGKSKSSKLKKFLSFLKSNMQCAWLVRKSDAVWFYNICMANIVCYIILKHIFRKKCFVILLDYTPNRSRFSVQHYIPYFINNSDGVVALSQRIHLENDNVRYKAGVIPEDKIMKRETNVCKKDKLTFLFSGNLNEHTGFPMLIDVFRDLPQCRLLISGHGNVDTEELSKYPNIEYVGYMEYADYLKLYDEADVCLSFRNPKFPENEYNFPSKILEFFCYGKIVLSTIEYPEISGFNYLYAKYDKSAITDAILKIMNLDVETIVRLKDNSRQLKDNFVPDSWKKTFEDVENGSSNGAY